MHVVRGEGLQNRSRFSDKETEVLLCYQGVCCDQIRGHKGGPEFAVLCCRTEIVAEQDNNTTRRSPLLHTLEKKHLVVPLSVKKPDL